MDEIRIIFIGNNNKQILFDLAILNHSFQLEPPHQPCLLNIHHLNLLLLSMLEHIPILIHSQHILDIVDHTIALVLLLLVGLVVHLDDVAGTRSLHQNASVTDMQSISLCYLADGVEFVAVDVQIYLGLHRQLSE